MLILINRKTKKVITFIRKKEIPENIEKIQIRLLYFTLWFLVNGSVYL